MALYLIPFRPLLRKIAGVYTYPADLIVLNAKLLRKYPVDVFACTAFHELYHANYRHADEETTTNAAHKMLQDFARHWSGNH